jgi:hypothetical protein
MVTRAGGRVLTVARLAFRLFTAYAGAEEAATEGTVLRRPANARKPACS